MKTYNRAGNPGGFNKGKEPFKFGPDSGDGEKNKIGATPEPNKASSEYDASVAKPRDPSLNAVPMPNKTARQVNKGIFNKISDYPTSVGGTLRPNKVN